MPCDKAALGDSRIRNSRGQRVATSARSTRAHVTTSTLSTDGCALCVDVTELRFDAFSLEHADGATDHATDLEGRTGGRLVNIPPQLYSAIVRGGRPLFAYYRSDHFVSHTLQRVLPEGWRDRSRDDIVKGYGSCERCTSVEMTEDDFEPLHWILEVFEILDFVARTGIEPAVSRTSVLRAAVERRRQAVQRFCA